MALIGKLFKGKGNNEAPLPVDRPSLPAEAPGPAASGDPPDADEVHELGGYLVKTIRLEDETEPTQDGADPSVDRAQAQETEHDADSLLADLSADPELGDQEGSEDGENRSLQADLLDVFEDEAGVDEQLEALTSHVEEVEAQELLEELESFMSELAAG